MVKDVYTIRRERLRALIKEVANDNQAKFARQAEIKSSQINRWLSETATDPRRIQEPSANYIEDKFNKPHGWLSREVLEANDSAVEAPAYVEFNRHIRAVIDIMKRLDEEQQIEVVGAAKVIENLNKVDSKVRRRADQ
jgi:hypothetical protein